MPKNATAVFQIECHKLCSTPLQQL